MLLYKCHIFQDKISSKKFGGCGKGVGGSRETCLGKRKGVALAGVNEPCGTGQRFLQKAASRQELQPLCKCCIVKTWGRTLLVSPRREPRLPVPASSQEIPLLRSPAASSQLSFQLRPGVCVWTRPLQLHASQLSKSCLGCC